MRDLIIVILILPGIPIAIWRPWIGILYWYWLGLMNPQTLGWSYAQTLQPALLVGVSVLIGMIFSKEKKTFPFNSLALLILLLWSLFAFTSWQAIYPDEAWVQFIKVSKIFLMTFVTIILIRTPVQLRLLLLVAAFSLGFWALNGAIWGILSGGANILYGPDRSFIADNNCLALALNMNLPILYLFSRYDGKRWVRITCLILFLSTIIAVVLTYSRGGFLGLAVVLSCIFFSAQNKLRSLIVLLIGVVIVSSFAPSQWYERIETINTYDQDASAMSRLNTWKYCWNLALDRPITGGGFEAFSSELFSKYAPWMETAYDAHSIYFEVLVEHGFPGLIIFLLIIIKFFLTLYRLNKISSNLPQIQWMWHYSRSLMASLLAFLVSGTFLGLAYFDFFWLLVGIPIIMSIILKEQLLSSLLSPSSGAAVDGKSSVQFHTVS